MTVKSAFCIFCKNRIALLTNLIRFSELKATSTIAITLSYFLKIILFDKFFHKEGH